MSKILIVGRLINETKTHYITQDTTGIRTWHKNWYRK